MLTLEHLKQDRVIAFSATDGGISEQWPVHRCIVFETADDEFLYVLSAGDWYRISRSFRDVVWNFVRELPQPAIALPGAELGIDEGIQPSRRRRPGRADLDDQLVAGPRSHRDLRLLTRDGSSVTSRSGSVFIAQPPVWQGVTSAELLLEDAAFRAEAHGIVLAADPGYADALGSERPAADTYEVVYVVITRSERSSPLTLPFFALVSLRAAVRRLRGMGYRVSATTVMEGSTRT